MEEIVIGRYTERVGSICKSCGQYRLDSRIISDCDGNVLEDYVRERCVDFENCDIVHSLSDYVHSNKCPKYMEHVVIGNAVYERDK